MKNFIIKIIAASLIGAILIGVKRIIPFEDLVLLVLAGVYIFLNYKKKDFL